MKEAKDVLIDINSINMDKQFTELVLEDIQMVMDQYNLTVDDLKKVVKILELTE